MRLLNVAGQETLSRRKLLKKSLGLGSALAVSSFAAGIGAGIGAGITPALAGSSSGYWIADEAAEPLAKYPMLFNTWERAMGTSRLLGDKVKVLDYLPMNSGRMNMLPVRDYSAVSNWMNELERMRSLSRLNQLKAINTYINAYPYRPDLAKTGMAERWNPPPELFRQGGDCEDYVVAKYLSLGHLGFNDDRLRLTILTLPRTRRTDPRRRMHAVLAVYIDDTAWILDNLSDDVYDHKTAYSYRPILSVNRETLWRHKV